MSNKANPWIQKLHTQCPVDQADIWYKVTFDVHPTNPQVDYDPLGAVSSGSVT